MLFITVIRLVFHETVQILNCIIDLAYYNDECNNVIFIKQRYAYHSIWYYGIW